MKRSYLGAASLLICAMAVSVSAQTPTRPSSTAQRPTATAAAAAVPATKIGLVDTTAFGVETTGIKRYVNAIKSVEREFQPRAKEIGDLQARMKVLADDINKIRGASVADPRSIQAKVDEGERLGREAKFKKEQADADFQKRYKELVGPVSSDIAKALDQFATQRGITLMLDVSKMLPAILTASPATDVTQAFITDYNGRNP
ncbi:MAG TPA: OmpH family outer membrane protein [Pyrinomonadaceae bacterium]|nr:OmpH family outer membrane protein [Pyrinomonadaceae bacterium]